MGGALAKEFDIESEQSCSGGKGYNYSIFNATEKATGNAVSIFRFDKKTGEFTTSTPGQKSLLPQGQKYSTCVYSSAAKSLCGKSLRFKVPQ
jgi:hypothetical protein